MGYSPWGHKESDATEHDHDEERAHTHTHIHTHTHTHRVRFIPAPSIVLTPRKHSQFFLFHL